MKDEIFICPSCGERVNGLEDLVICDDCLQEAQAIRQVQKELEELEADSHHYTIGKLTQHTVEVICWNGD